MTQKILYLKASKDSGTQIPLLEKTGYHVDVFDEVGNAYLALRQTTYHLGIVDGGLSWAINFIQRAKLEEKWKAPLIFIATYPISLEKGQLEAFSAGRVRFLEYPCDWDSLTATLYELLPLDFNKAEEILAINRRELSAGADGNFCCAALRVFVSELDRIWEAIYRVEGRFFKRLLLLIKTAAQNLSEEGGCTPAQLAVFEKGVALLKGEEEVTAEVLNAYRDELTTADIDLMLRPKTEAGIEKLLAMYQRDMAAGRV